MDFPEFNITHPQDLLKFIYEQFKKLIARVETIERALEIAPPSEISPDSGSSQSSPTEPKDDTSSD